MRMALLKKSNSKNKATAAAQVDSKKEETTTLAANGSAPTPAPTPAPTAAPDIIVSATPAAQQEEQMAASGEPLSPGSGPGPEDGSEDIVQGNRKSRSNSDLSYESNIARLEASEITEIDSRILNFIKEDDKSRKKRKEEEETPELIQLEIDLLIGKRTQWSTESQEVQNFRESIQQAKEEAKKRPQQPPPLSSLLPTYINTDPLPPELPTTFICRIQLIDDNMTKTERCNGLETAQTFIEYIIEKWNRIHSFSKASSDFVLKATGVVEYIHGPNRIIDFEYVRSTLKKQGTIEFKLVDLNTIDLDIEAAMVSYEGTNRISYNHEEIHAEETNWYLMNSISIWDINRPFRVKVSGVDCIRLSWQLKEAIPDIAQFNEGLLYIVADLYHGGERVAEQKISNVVPFSHCPRWNQWLVFPDLLISHMPSNTRICFTLYARAYNRNDTMLTDPAAKPYIGKTDFPIGWVGCQLVNHVGHLRTGKTSLRMWPDEPANPIGTTVDNLGSEKAAVLGIEFDEYALPVVVPTGRLPAAWIQDFMNRDAAGKAAFEAAYAATNGHTKSKKEELERIIQTDPLYVMTEEDKKLVWHSRDELINQPKALTKFLASVDWKEPVAVWIAQQLLDQWAPLDPIDALELLDSHHGEGKVREYAVRRLRNLSDAQLAEFILQLIQTLKYEPYHDSALARFLLDRAVQCTYLIGHQFFWHLKAEMHVSHVRERHGLLLEEYLRTCSVHRRDLVKQGTVVNQLLSVAMKIKKTRKQDQLSVLRSELAKLQLPSVFKLPLSPRLEASGIIYEKCKVMDSKKLPCWLVFKNADATGAPIYVIFKAGDDLRQDLLTLQMLRIMDSFWKRHNLDLHLIPYGCIATGDGVGMIEVVLNSDTIANITGEFGGATAAFDKEPLKIWLEANNPVDKMGLVVENFVRSCAGYCVATYVLGIGDRHNDNIMLTRTGDLFHIDFGHFLGHFKKFAGVKREAAPFVFTPMYCHVMGGVDSEAYKKFADLSGQAYNIVRKHGHLFENLFKLMLSTGIPELTSVEDIFWLRKCLILEESDEQAYAKFQELIIKSLKTVRTQINDAVHILAHRNK